MPVKPGEREEEYFARLELERKNKAAAEKQAQLKEEERQKLKETHFMHCPKCGMKLVEINYKGITIDECSSCQGVWLDAGELKRASELEKGALDKLFSIFTPSS